MDKHRSIDENQVPKAKTGSELTRDAASLFRTDPAKTIELSKQTEGISTSTQKETNHKEASIKRIATAMGIAGLAVEIYGAIAIFSAASPFPGAGMMMAGVAILFGAGIVANSEPANRDNAAGKSGE